MCVCACVSLYLAWILTVEVFLYLQVCAFAGEVDPDMKGKVIIRLMNITELQSLLESCMAGECMGPHGSASGDSHVTIL